MAPKVKKEAPDPPKAEAKAKAFKTKKANAEKHPQPQKEDMNVTHILLYQDIAAPEAAQIPSEEYPQEKQA